MRLHPFDGEGAIGRQLLRTGDVQWLFAAVEGDYRRIGDQEAGAAAGGSARRDQARVVCGEAREDRQERDREHCGGGDRDHPDGRGVPVKRSRRQQGEGGQGQVEVAMTAGVGADGDQPEDRREIGERRNIKEAKYRPLAPVQGAADHRP